MKTETTAWKLTGVSAALHFLVDGLCVCCLYLVSDHFSTPWLMGVFMLYNVMAFLTQPLTGMLADRQLGRHWMLLGTAVALLAAGTAVGAWMTTVHDVPLAGLLAAALLLGAGNSLFHVWGGKLTAVASRNDARHLGTFVSTGAFGLAVGVLIHSWWLLMAMLVAICLLSYYVYAVWGGMAFTASFLRNGNSRPTLPAWAVWCSLLVLMSMVMLRSLVGETFAAGISRGALTALFIGFVAMLGKMGGGWIVRRVGIVVALVLAVAIVVACLLLQQVGEGIRWAGLLAVNLTMAMTLYLANAAMKGREGLAFGLLAATLMPGYMLAQVGTTGAEALPSLLLTLLPTIAIEVGVLWLIREKRADVLWSAVVVNMLTNIPLNLYLTYISGTWAALVVAEVIVFVVEALWYWYFCRSLRTGMLYSLLCNGTSLLTGLFVQILIFQL